MTCCLDKSKRMSVCSNEVCSLSEIKSAVRAMESLIEDPSRASPIPFTKGDVVSEAYKASAQELLSQSEGVQTAEEGNVQITRKTKVEESFVKSQKMYSAEISSSSQPSVHVRATSPEMEQIMERRQTYQSYHDTSRSTPNTLAMQHKTLQSDRCLTPEIENIMGKPHGTWSPMPAACFVRPITPSQIISFPPDIPTMSAIQSHPRTATPEQFQEARETVERFVDHSKHVQHSQTATTEKTPQSYYQQTGQTQQLSSLQYDKSHELSASSVKGSQGYGTLYSNDFQNQTSFSYGNGTKDRVYEKQHNNGNGSSEQPQKDNHGGGNGNFNKNGNGNPGGDNLNGNEGEENPTVTEPDDTEEKYSRKSSRTDQSQKSSRKTSSVSEEESSRRVFSDFGGPQISSAMNVESVTEGGTQKTSVTKSRKMEYASCEFESSRKSTIIQDGSTLSEDTSEKKSQTSGDSRKHSVPTYSGGEPGNEEEMVTKSQVEEIIKQELNKVFQMAQIMEKTNFGEMYDEKSQQSSSKQHYKQSSENESVQVVGQSSKKTTISDYGNNKISQGGEILTKTGKLTTGLTIAPDRSFTPQALESNYPLPYQNIPSDFPLPRSHPEPPSSKPGYIPVSGDRDSPLLQALTIASDRPYSPLPSATISETPSFVTAPKQKSSMLEALTTAPSTTVHLKGVTVDNSMSKTETIQNISETKYESAQKYAPRPTKADFKPIPVEIKPLTSYVGTNQSSETLTSSSFPPVTDELKSAFKKTSKTQFTSSSETEKHESEISNQTVSTSQHKHLSATITERPITPSGLHPPNLLPYYQQNIGEIPLAHRSNSPVPHQIKAPTITPPRAQSVPRQEERRGSVKAMSEAYNQQITGQNNQQLQSAQTGQASSSVSYVSSGVYSSGAITKAYSYEQEHKSIDAMGYHASPLAGKLPLAGEQTLPKCSSPVLGKLDHTKQVFKPAITIPQPASAFKSPIAEQANLRQAPPYFVQEKDKPEVPWKVVKETNNEEVVDSSSFKSTQQTFPTQPSFKPSFPSIVKKAPAFPEPSKPSVIQPPLAIPDAGPGGAPKAGTTAGTSAPRRGRGILNSAVGAGVRIPLCASCNSQIRGPFITALGKIWCPDHFVCVNANCRRPLQDIGFVEDAQGLYCEYCFEKYLAPSCNKCNAKVKGDCLNAIGKHFHPECFTCAYCGKLFGNSPFFLEDALPYCEADWNELFTTKCFSCGFPIEAGDRWVEALNNNYHSQCFNCTMCKKNLEGQSFFAKGGRPFCKNHAR